MKLIILLAIVTMVVVISADQQCWTSEPGCEGTDVCGGERGVRCLVHPLSNPVCKGINCSGDRRVCHQCYCCKQT
jgi:hypothetical protein